VGYGRCEHIDADGHFRPGYDPARSLREPMRRILPVITTDARLHDAGHTAGTLLGELHADMHVMWTCT
jgi:hypothetical protein